MDDLSESEMELNYDEEPEVDNEPIQYEMEDEPIIVQDESASKQQQQSEPVAKIDLCAEDLFGDIDDVDDDNDFMTAYSEAEAIANKRQKLSEEQIRLGMIEQILETRRKYRESQEFSFARSKDNRMNSSLGRRYQQFGVNLSENVPNWPAIEMRNETGKLLYVRFHSREFLQTKIDEIDRDLKSESFVDNSDELWKEANLILTKSANTVCTTTDLTKTNPVLESKKELWTSFYKPKLYIELLSDEMINRALLKWIKLWDFEVFKKSLSLYDSGETNKDTQNETADSNDKSKFPKKFQKQQVPLKLDASNRPEFKLALLCGPPGIGKTTMAYLIASKAGYNVIEVNASDERTVEAFQSVLENATQMQSLAVFNPKPNCIVLDEIDGAPQQTVDYLLKFIADSKTKQRKGAKKQYLRRPIICICNDVYAPALRSLRQVAYQINFNGISKNRLSERLMEVCQKEGIATDLITLSALCEKTNNDIRSCLTFLYFFKNNSQTKKRLNLSDIQQSDIGEKDFKADLFSVWRKIFYLDRTEKKSLENRARDLNKIIDNFNEYPKLMMGVFENYLMFIENLSLTSDALIEAIETFSFHDFLQTNIDSHQNFHLIPYLSRSFRIWHFVFSTFNNRLRITYPTYFNEVIYFNMKLLAKKKEFKLTYFKYLLQ